MDDEIPKGKELTYRACELIRNSNSCELRSVVNKLLDRISNLEAPPSDAEVEAAAEAMWEATKLPSYAKWERYNDSETKDMFRTEARAALTAFVAGRNA